MRLQLILPHVEPTEFEMPLECPYKDCHGKHFRHHQEVEKPVKDTNAKGVKRCLPSATSVCGASGPSGCIPVGSAGRRLRNA